MRKIVASLLLVSILCAACGEKKKYKIEGKLSNLNGKSVYTIVEKGTGAPEYQTIDTPDGVFTIEGESDSIVMISFMLNDKMTFAKVYVKNGETVLLEGDSDNPFQVKISGTERNEDVYNFKASQAQLFTRLSNARKQNLVREIDSLTLLQNKWVQQYITEHPDKESSSILMYDYLLDDTNFALCDTLLSGLQPQAKPYYIQKRLQNLISRYEISAPGKELPSFSIYIPNETSVSSYMLRGKPALLYFWTSANMVNREINDTLKKVYKKQNKELTMINISLDNDSVSWRQQLKSDSLAWRQVRLPETWSHDIINNLGIYKTPFLLVLDPNGKIVARNPAKNRISFLSDSLVNEMKKEKELKKAQQQKR